ASAAELYVSPMCWFSRACKPSPCQVWARINALRCLEEGPRVRARALSQCGATQARSEMRAPGLGIMDDALNFMSRLCESRGTQSRLDRQRPSLQFILACF